MVAEALTRTEIEKDWKWLLDHISETLSSFNNDDDITEFVCCKIEAGLAIFQQNHCEVNLTDLVESNSFRNTTSKFQKLFNMPSEEKLVNYYSCW